MDPRLQPGQSLAHGPDPGDRLPRGRRDRFPREHRPADGRGAARARGDAELRRADQLHDSGHDPVAGGRVPAAGLHERARRPHLPRVRGHDHRLHHRQRRRLAYAHAADVLAPAGPARPPGKEGLDGAPERRRGEARPGALRPLALVLPASPLDIGRDLGRLPRRHDLSLHRRAEVVPARGRQLLHPRRDGRAGRHLARADARPRHEGGGSSPRKLRRANDIHRHVAQPVPAGEPGVPAGFPGRPRQTAAHRGGRRSIDGRRQPRRARRHGLPPAEPGAADQHRRHGHSAGQVRLRRLRH